jgi:hypothetical protein
MGVSSRIHALIRPSLCARATFSRLREKDELVGSLKLRRHSPDGADDFLRRVVEIIGGNDV